MADIPIQSVEVSGGPSRGLNAALVAEADGFKAQITTINNGLENRREYRLESNGIVATVSVNFTDSTASNYRGQTLNALPVGEPAFFSNSVGRIRDSQGTAVDNRIVEAMETAFASGGISPQELASLVTLNEMAQSLPAQAGRISRVR